MALAILMLLLAAASRLVPHALHGVGLNITAVGGGLLCCGSRAARGTGKAKMWRSAKVWLAALAALAVMAATDVYLTTRVYNVPFHVRSYVVTWAWYAGVSLMASGLLRRVSVGRVAAGVFGSATSFFVLSNFAVWAAGGMYPQTASGLGACFAAALPFYGNDLVSTGLCAGVLFGLPAAAASLQAMMRATPQRTA